MFSQYCQQPFQVEPVSVTMPDGTSTVYPKLASRVFETSPEYINRGIGLSLSGEEVGPPGAARLAR
jgi:phenylalanyl-tRNA synthetase beta chain